MIQRKEWAPWTKIPGGNREGWSQIREREEAAEKGGLADTEEREVGAELRRVGGKDVIGGGVTKGVKKFSLWNMFFYSKNMYYFWQNRS